MSTPRPSRRPFRFGLQAFEAASAADWKATARRAEALGYSTLFTSDHYFGPGRIADRTGHRPVDLAPLSAMAIAAAATETLKVGCRVFAADYHQPVVLAKETATLDFLTDGRVEVGIGAGWVADEYEGMGIEMDRPGVRIARMAETVGLLRAHWSGEELDVSGEHVNVSGFRGVPAPVSPGGPPIMIGGGAPRVLRLAGRLADIVSINFNNASGKLGAQSVASSTAERTHEKLSWVREGAGDRFDEIELETAAYFVVVTDQPGPALGAMAARFGVEPEVFADVPHAFIGTVEQICEQLDQRREEFGFSYVTIAQRNMEDFAPIVAAMNGK
ncbi:MAG: TIGR03621 family F420-dependent LLM class oxidoreductase [Ilumatobacteraceae bacterium]